MCNCKRIENFKCAISNIMLLWKQNSNIISGLLSLSECFLLLLLFFFLRCSRSAPIFVFLIQVMKTSFYIFVTHELISVVYLGNPDT